MALEIIKYQGTKNFFSSLCFDKESEKYFFYFSKTYPPEIVLNEDENFAYGKFGEKITSFIEKRTLTFSVKNCGFGKDKLFCLIEIKPTEFDSMYKLLECVWE